MIIPRPVSQGGTSRFGEIYTAGIFETSNTGAILSLRTNYNNSVDAQYDWIAIGD